MGYTKMTSDRPVLTERQREILAFLTERAYSDAGIPSLREIMERFGFSSPSTVSDHLDALEKKGVIIRQPGRSRNIILSHRGRQIARESAMLSIPFYGSIPAGMPSDAEQGADRCIAIDPDTIQLPRNARTFALQVRGESMIGAGIFDKDIAIFEFAEPRNRDIVAALIDGETTLKRYIVQRGRPFLKAENPAFPDLIPAQELVIQGVLRTLIRNF